MIVKFTTGNFNSFKEPTALSLKASALSENQDYQFETPLTDLSLLKSAVIYGQNSSGKSNMFKALRFMRWFMLNSAKDFQASEKIDVSSFQLSTVTVDQPSFFEIEMIIDEVKYKYGFRVDKNIVHEEWLFVTRKIKEYILFHRHRQDIKVEGRFDFPKQLVDRTRENALALSVGALFNNHIAVEIIKKIDGFKMVSGVRDESHIDFTAKMLDDKKYAHLIKEFVLSAKLGFTDFKTEKVKITEEMLGNGLPEEIKTLFLKNRKDRIFVSTSHQVFDENNIPVGNTYFDLIQNESLGTQKYFSLAGPVIDTLTKGGVIIVDEFSSRMNPMLCEAIIRLFNSTENNPNNAQFIFITHNLSFVSRNRDLFRRDQMILFNKNKYGASEVISLYDLRIRKDASYEKEYLGLMFEQGYPKIDLSHQLGLFGSSS